MYDLFNKTKTVGGSDALERMLKDPSGERSVVETRRDSIRFFRDRNIELPIGRHLTDIEHYLDCAFELFPGNLPETLVYQLRNQLKESPRYYIVTGGVKRTVSLLRQLFEVTAGWRTAHCPQPLLTILNDLPDLITDRRIRDLLLERSGPLGWRDMARCDHFFRETGKGVMRKILDLVYEWDAYESVAAAARRYDLCFPEYNEDAQPLIQASGLFHPLVTNPVPNDYRIGSATNLCFVSGPNMAGKSTFLKSFGLAVYLAHLGFPVPAKSFQTTLFNGLITTVNLADSISQGYSHFYAEVSRVKDVVSKICEKKRIVVIFDELFRGTNVRDASDASLEIIDAFAGIKDCLFVVSTHIVEIAPELQGNPHIFFSCFAATMEAGVPWYSYKLKEGVSDERAGMAILRNEGILDMLAGMRYRG